MLSGATNLALPPVICTIDPSNIEYFLKSNHFEARFHYVIDTDLFTLLHNSAL